MVLTLKNIKKERECNGSLAMTVDHTRPDESTQLLLLLRSEMTKDPQPLGRVTNCITRTSQVGHPN